MGLDRSLSGQNPKLDRGPVQGQMLNHGLDQGSVQNGSGSDCGSGLNRGKPNYEANTKGSKQLCAPDASTPNPSKCAHVQKTCTNCKKIQP